MVSRPLLNALWHSNFCVRGKVDSLKQKHKTSSKIVAKFFSHDKNRKTNFSRRKNSRQTLTNCHIKIKQHTKIKKVVIIHEKILSIRFAQSQSNLNRWYMWYVNDPKVYLHTTEVEGLVQFLRCVGSSFN